MVDSAIEANLFTIISNTHQSWHSHPMVCFTGVRGHASPEKCQNLRLEMVLSEAYKAQISSCFFFGGGTEGIEPLPLDQLLIG